MNKKLLTAALLGGLAVAQSASAQEFDDRWYLTGSVGFNFQDSGRGTEDAPFGTIGLGKFISPVWSVDGELNYQNPSFDDNNDLNWSQYGASLDFRRHLIQEGRGFNPYLLFGIGYQYSEEEYTVPSPNAPAQRAEGTGAAHDGAALDFRRHFSQDGRGFTPYLLFGIGYQYSEEEYTVPSPNSPAQRAEGNVAAKVGAGLQSTFDNRVAVRAEIAYRADFDDQ